MIIRFDSIFYNDDGKNIEMMQDTRFIMAVKDEIESWGYKTAL